MIRPHVGAANRVAPRVVRPRAAGLDWSTRVRWGAAILVVLAVLIWLTSSVFSMLFASAVMAYLLDPALSFMERHRISRSTGVIVLAGALTIGALVLALVVIPTFVAQIGELATNLRPYLANLSTRIGPWRAEIEGRLGVHIPVDLDELAAVAPGLLQQLSPETRSSITSVLSRAINAVSAGGIGAVATVFQFTLLPPFVFFLAVDWPKIVSGVDDLVPPRWRPRARQVAGRIDERIFAFVKGQLLVAAALGVIYSIGLLIAGIDLPIVVGMLSGVLFLVPYLGGIVGVAMAGSLALLKFGFDWHVLVCIATFVGGQGLEGFVLTPWLVGDRVGLHPMVVIVALIVGGNLLGIWGLVLAIPVTAVLAVLGDELLGVYRQSPFYRG